MQCRSMPRRKKASNAPSTHSCSTPTRRWSSLSRIAVGRDETKSTSPPNAFCIRMSRASAASARIISVSHTRPSRRLKPKPLELDWTVIQKFGYGAFVFCK